MPEYEDYLLRSEETLAAATILFENKKFNSAVSEAYYSMYHGARALLSYRDFHPKSHSGVVSLLGLEFVKEGFLDDVYGKMFARDMQLREKADYDVTYRASEEDAKCIIEDATVFLEKIKEVIERL
jgi:uncharacterized protein